jgi:hypothetical protein
MAAPEMTLAPHRDLSANDARKITDRIKSSMGDIMSDIAKAHIGRVWIALGYAAWGDYIKGEFAHAPLSLPREERKAVVSLLRGQGMSTRAIASATGTSDGTVRNDLSGAQNYATEPPSTPGPVGASDETPDLEPLDVDVDEDALAEELIAAEPVRITGLDGRSYQSHRPQPTTVAVQPAPAQTVTCPTCHGTGKVTQ